MSEDLNPQGRNGDSQDTPIPEDMRKALEGIPEEQRKRITSMMISQYSLFERISPDASLVKKITEDHITKMLETQERAMEHSFQEDHEKRWFLLGSVIVAVGTLITLVVLLKNSPDLMERVITLAFGGILGAAGGYGIGFRNGKKDDQ